MALGHSLAVETPGHNERGVQSYEDEQHGKLFFPLYWSYIISTLSFFKAMEVLQLEHLQFKS